MTTQSDLERAMEAVAARERRRQSKRALIIVGTIAVVFITLFVLVNMIPD